MAIVTLLLQLVVGEAGWQAESDHAAMLHAYQRLAAASGLTLREAKVHTPEMNAGYPRPHRRWLRTLSPACSEPAAWLRGNWDAGYVYLCARVTAAVRAFRRGELRDPCRGKPTQWRARSCPECQRKARRKGWRRIGCGRETLHVYWEP